MGLWYLWIALGMAVANSGGRVEHPTINLAVLLPIADDRRPFSAVRLRPAVDLAVDRVASVFRRRLLVSYRDSNCSEAHGINEAFNCYLGGPPNVYFGPICDYAVAPVARQTYFWGIPVVSVGALALDFLVHRRVSYPLLTRAGPVNFIGMASAILEVMQEYAWRRVTVLYEREARSEVIPPFCHLATENVIYLLDFESPQRIVRKDYKKIDEDPTKTNLEDVLVNEVGHEFAGTCMTYSICLASN